MISKTVPIGWETVREITLGSSQLGAYNLTEERLMNPTKYRATDINATKEVLSTIRIQRTKRALPIRMISEFFFKDEI